MSLSQRIAHTLDELFRAIKFLAAALVMGLGISLASADVGINIAKYIASTTIFANAVTNGALVIKGTSVNGADNNSVCLDSSDGGCTDSGSRSAYLYMAGEQSTGDFGANAVDDFYVQTGAATLALLIDQAQAATFYGTVRSAATGSLGWVPVAAADQACNTTCTSACVMGFNLTAGNITGSILDCTDAAADVCLCAGAS